MSIHGPSGPNSSNISGKAPPVVGGFQGGRGNAILHLGAAPALCRNAPCVCVCVCVCVGGGGEARKAPPNMHASKGSVLASHQCEPW